MELQINIKEYFDISKVINIWHILGFVHFWARICTEKTQT